jgi:hypothetical protein
MRHTLAVLERFLPVLLLCACGSAGEATPDAPGTPDAGAAARDERIPDRALVEWMGVEWTAGGEPRPWWIEERIAPQPMVAGDHDLGPRAVVRGEPERRVVWLPQDTDRLTDACLHPSGEWSAVGVEADMRLFLARGGPEGLRDRIVLDDPALAGDPNAWIGTSPDALRVNALSEASPSIAADGEDVVVSVWSEDNAVLAYRWSRREGAFARGPRTLVSPALLVTPFLPIGGSYDDFDAVVSPYQTRLAVDAAGRAFVATFTDQNRLVRHNAVFGTSLDLLRDVLAPRQNTSDALLSRVDRDGSIGFAVIVGTVDVEDEIFGIAVGAQRVALLGRNRRELGRDNTELHVMIAQADLDGTPLGTTTFDALDSGLAQTGAYVGGELWVGGTEGWLQNPSGRSVFEEGQPFLIRLGAGTPERLDALLPPTEGHAELRALRVERGTLFAGGHELGPLTHTGDADPALIRSDAWYRIAPVQR